MNIYNILFTVGQINNKNKMVAATCRLCGDFKGRKQGGIAYSVQCSTEKVEFSNLKKNHNPKSVHAQNFI